MSIPTEIRRIQAGLSLIETLVFMVVVSVGVVGLLSTISPMVQSSGDPVVARQAMAIAESLLSEIEQQPFTYCDPDDANFASAASTADCTGGAAGSQDKGGADLTTPTPVAETRYSASNPFDNVADYGGFSMSPIHSVDEGTIPVTGLEGYTASVAITRAGAAFSLPNDAVLRIDVRVQNGPTDITLTGYRFRYAPNS
jgi:MSHA pilin protein MshD